mmetsp:Transcript_14790/g.31931  ORF Transcript_14790/g.31931 Transcript_14790/m.31931 type:complete len:225 (+) Transcript_14790:320-994(+)
MEWSDSGTENSLNFVLSIDTYHCICSNAPLLNPLSVLRVAIFYPPEFLGTARRLIVVEFIPYSSDEPSAITFSAVFDTLALTVVSVVFVGSSVSRRSQTFGQIPPVVLLAAILQIFKHESTSRLSNVIRCLSVVNTNMITPFPVRIVQRSCIGSATSFHNAIVVPPRVVPLATILKGGTCPRWVQLHVLRKLFIEDTSIISEPIRPKLGLRSGCHRRGGCRRYG